LEKRTDQSVHTHTLACVHGILPLKPSHLDLKPVSCTGAANARHSWAAQRKRKRWQTNQTSRQTQTSTGHSARRRGPDRRNWSVADMDTYSCCGYNSARVWTELATERIRSSRDLMEGQAGGRMLANAEVDGGWAQP